jgi:ABC-type Fe3+ transport system permease subunit
MPGPNVLHVLRLLVIVLIGTTFAVVSGRSLYGDFRRRGVSVRGVSYRRSKQPLHYWFSMTTGVFFLLLVVIAMIVLAFRG